MTSYEKPRRRDLSLAEIKESPIWDEVDLDSGDDMADSVTIEKIKTDSFRHLLAHLPDSLSRDRTVAKPHIEALAGSTIFIHDRPIALERFLGRGAFGVVFLAHDEIMNTRVVVKLSAPYDHKVFANPDHASKTEVQAAHMGRTAMTEMSALKRLTRDADNQPLQRDGGEPPFPILIEGQLIREPMADRSKHDIRIAAEVLEYIDGKNLEQTVKQVHNLQLDLPRLQKISLGLIRAVRRMHEAGVLHLDLKSSNVVLDAQDNPIVLDFGASQLPDKWNTTAATWAKPVLRTRTPRYTTPADKASEPTPQHDIYSLGITLRDMIYGYIPEEDVSAVRETLTEEVRVLDQVILAMTQGNPSERISLVDAEQQLRTNWQLLEDQAALDATKAAIENIA